MESWKDLKWLETANLFSKDVKYYENPIDWLCSSRDEVLELWNVVKDNQLVFFYNFEIILHDDDYAIINWQMEREYNWQRQFIDWIFQISINDKNKCTFFKQWRFTK